MRRQGYQKSAWYLLRDPVCECSICQECVLVHRLKAQRYHALVQEMRGPRGCGARADGGGGQGVLGVLRRHHRRLVSGRRGRQPGVLLPAVLGCATRRGAVVTLCWHRQGCACRRRSLRKIAEDVSMPIRQRDIFTQIVLGDEVPTSGILRTSLTLPVFQNRTAHESSARALLYAANVCLRLSSLH